MAAIGGARARPPRRWPWPRRSQGGGAARCGGFGAGAGKRSSPPMPTTSKRRGTRASARRCSTVWRSTRSGSKPSPRAEDDRRLARPGRARARRVGPAERAQIRGSRAARGDRHHLREPAERDRRCRRARLKSGNAAILRGGSESFHSSRASGRGAARGLARGRSAGGGDPARADPRPRRGRHDADDERHHRRHRAARWRVADRAGAAREPHPGHRPSRRARATPTSTAPPIRRRRARSC